MRIRLLTASTLIAVSLALIYQTHWERAPITTHREASEIAPVHVTPGASMSKGVPKGTAANTPPRFSSAAAAWDAVLVGASSYDEEVVSLLREPPSDCAWCDGLYSRIRAELDAKTRPGSEREFLLEILAVSGRRENLQFIFDGISNSDSAADRERFLQAAEFVVGGDPILDQLEVFLKSDEPLLREAGLSAITNHGSEKAVKILLADAERNGEGADQLGLGLGEIVPDPEALPLLIAIAQQSHHSGVRAFKALLNAGLPGLNAAVELLKSGVQDDAVIQQLNDVTRHVRNEPGVIEYLTLLAADTEHSAVRAFAQASLSALASHNTGPSDAST